MKRLLRERLANIAGANWHPETDLLAAFAERTLGAALRERVLLHLAACSECRDVVALVVPAVEVEERAAASAGRAQANPEARDRSPYSRLAVWSISTALAATLLLITLVHRPDRRQYSRAPKPIATSANAGTAIKSYSANSEKATSLSTAEVVASNKPLEPAPQARRSLREDGSRTPGRVKRGSASDGTPLAEARGPDLHAALALGKTDSAAAGSNSSAAAKLDAMNILPPKPQQQQPIAGNRAVTQEQQVESQAQGLVEERPDAGATQRPATAQLWARGSDESVKSPAGPAPTANLGVGAGRGPRYAPAPAPPPVVTPPAAASTAKPEAAPSGLMTSATAMARQQTTRRQYPRAVWRISAEGELQRSFDRGARWQSVQFDTAGVFRALSVVGSDVWAGGSGGLFFHSSDSGATWKPILLTTGASPQFAEPLQFAGEQPLGDIVEIVFSDARHGTVATSAGAHWITSDGGAKWIPQGSR